MNATQKANGTTLVVKPAKVTKQPEKMEIQDIERIVIAVTIVGTSPLIVHNFDAKTIQEMEDERALTPQEKAQKKREPRPPVDPRDRFQRARVLDERGRDCIEAKWVKAMLKTGCTRYEDVEIFGTQAGMIYVHGDLLPITYAKVEAFGPSDRYPLGHDGKGPLLRRDPVRVGKGKVKQPDLRYRPEYRDWSVPLKIEFEPSILSVKGLHHLLRRCGTGIGLCELRPEKGHDNGRFDLKSALDLMVKS